MKDFPVTQGLLDLISNLPPTTDRIEVLNYVKSGIQHYKQEFNRAVGESNLESAVIGFYDLMDENSNTMDVETKSKISCRKGCAHCCHLFVSVSVREAVVIKGFCEDNNMPLDEDYLTTQSKYTPENYTTQEKTACVFLNERNECKIYDVRPLACRKYFVITEPKLCNSKEYPKGIIGKISDINAELMASAMIDDGYSLSQSLLKII